MSASVWRCAAHPRQSTIRRARLALDADDMDRAVSDWLAERALASAEPDEPVVTAVDGKSASTACSGGDRAVHLLSALDAGTGVVVGQMVVGRETNEIDAFASLPDRFEVTGAT